MRIIERANTRVDLDGYFERHHVIPRCLNGTDEASNLVNLTAKEHYICHMLLIRMVEGRAIWQMVKAAHLMTVGGANHQRRVTARSFAQLRVAAAEAHGHLTRGRPKHSPESRRKISEARSGKPTTTGRSMPDHVREALKEANSNRPPASAETRAKISAANRGQTRGEDTREKMRIARARQVRGPMSEETKIKISTALKGRPSQMKGRKPWTYGRGHSEESISKMRESHRHREKVSCEHCGQEVQKATFARWHGDRCKCRQR